MAKAKERVLARAKAVVKAAAMPAVVEVAGGVAVAVEVAGEEAAHMILLSSSLVQKQFQLCQSWNQNHFKARRCLVAMQMHCWRN